MLDLDWYHSIEIAPGVFTPGHDGRNISLTRDVLGRCQIEGATCLDVGTMDGLVAVLLCRRKAGRVVACDRYDRQSRIAFIKQNLNVEFDYLGGLTLAEARRRSESLLTEPFDVIVFSGVLYHMYDPMAGLAIIRSMVRPGGIIVVETYAVLATPMVSYFNANGAIASDPHNYWSMSVTLLDYLFRYFKLRALDVRYFTIEDAAAEGAKLLRVCVPCQVVGHSLAEPGDNFMEHNPRDDDAEFPIWNGNTSKPPLVYSPASGSLPVGTAGSVKLYEAITTTAPVAIGDSRPRLALSDHI